MPRLHLVPVVRVTNAFEARVIAARLGAEGFVTQLRGAIDSPYPMGEVEVLVDQGELEEISALLLADEVESAFEDVVDVADQPRCARPRIGPWVAGVLAALLVIADILTVAGRW